MRNAFSRVNKILEAAGRMLPARIEGKYDRNLETLRSRFTDTNIYSEYAEPGYTAKGPILTGNWNEVEGDNGLMRRVGEILEKIGCELEWEDEWCDCHSCGKLVRSQPDCYHWTASYAIVNDCELLCHECLKQDIIPYLEEMEGKTSNAITFDVNLADHGYVRIDKTYESGWYGTNDDPKAIGKALRSKGIGRFIFIVDGKGQFNMEFSVWVHGSQADMLNEEVEA